MYKPTTEIMTPIRKQYKKFQIIIKRIENGLFQYVVKGTTIKSVATSTNEAHCCALDDIEDYLQSK